MNRWWVKRRRLFDAAFWALLLPVYLLLKVIPRNRRLVVYGSSLGWHFADNSKYLFLYASAHVDSVESVFISKNIDDVRFIRDNGHRAEYLYTIKGLTKVLRAGKAFISHSGEDIHPVFLSGAEVIELWHGTPIRKVVHDCDWNLMDAAWFDRSKRWKTSLMRLIWRILPYTHSQDRFDKIVIASEAVMPSFRTAFRISDDRAVVLGQPRNDCLIGDVDFDERFFPEIEALAKLRERAGLLVSWLPTHRSQLSSGIVEFFGSYGYNPQDLKDVCEKHDITLVIKPHFLAKADVERHLGGNERFIVYEHVDPYPLLRQTDILITDYSSVYLDFLLLNRPILFTPFDYEDYVRHSADLYYDYAEITPGPKCRDWPSLLAELDRTAAAVTSGEDDRWAEQRRSISRRFNRYQNGFCRRVVDEFLK